MRVNSDITCTCCKIYTISILILLIRRVDKCMQLFLPTPRVNSTSSIIFSKHQRDEGLTLHFLEYLKTFETVQNSERTRQIKIISKMFLCIKTYFSIDSYSLFKLFVAKNSDEKRFLSKIKSLMGLCYHQSKEPDYYSIQGTTMSCRWIMLHR